MNKKQLDASTLIFYSTLDVIITPIILIDKTDKRLFTNQAFKNQIGYDLDEVYDKRIWLESAFPDTGYREETIRRWREQLLVSRPEDSLHVQLLAKVYCKNNQYRWYEIHEYTLGEDKMITFINMDDVKTKNEELLKTIQFNALLNAAIVHDIRTPLATLKSLIQLKSKIPDDTKIDVRTVLSRIDNQINRIFDIIDSSVLHHSDQLRHFRFKPQEISLNQLIGKVQSYYDEEMASSGKKWATNVGAQYHVYYDLFILEVMLRNIISNAVKYTPPLEIITVHVENTIDYTAIHIEDKGGGITEEELNFINNPLIKHRQNERTDLRMGFGIGLVISKEMLESHGGRLEITSRPSIGSTFTIQIPTHTPS